MSRTEAAALADAVGPVLRAGEDADAVIQAIRDDNPDREVQVIDSGAYVRVQAVGFLRVTLASLQRTLGPAFEMRQLGAMMPAFAGRIATSTDETSWRYARAEGAP